MQMEIAKTAMRRLGRDCLRLFVEGKTLKDILKSLGLDAVAVVGGS